MSFLSKLFGGGKSDEEIFLRTLAYCNVDASFHYTSKSDKKIKMFIFIFKILRKINNKMFYFGLSLLTMLLLDNYFFNVSSFGILLTHMVFWELFHHKYLNPNEIKEDNEDLDL